MIQFVIAGVTLTVQSHPPGDGAMLKPLLVVIAIIVIVSGLTCVMRRHVVFTAASGRPFDHMGDKIKCPKCNEGGTRAGRGYWYHCPHCKEHYQMKWNEAEKKIEVW